MQRKDVENEGRVFKRNGENKKRNETTSVVTTVRYS
jgi:hypothetical protein